MFKRATTALLFVTLPAFLLAGCGGSLSPSSTCGDFNRASDQEQQEVVVKMYEKAHPTYTGVNLQMGAANAFMNVTYSCGKQPALTLSAVGM